MQSVVNVRDIIKLLAKNGLGIGDKSLLNYYIKNFNYNTFILQYSAPFLIDAEHGRYDREAISDEMIALYKFDRDMANHILRFILVVEKIINTNVIYEIINEYHIIDKCLFKLQPSFIEHQILVNLKDVEPRVTYVNFMKKLIKFLPTSEMTKKYMQKNIYDEVIRWRNCPLDVMCLTWSFATTLSLFIALDKRVQNRILYNLGLNADHLNGFIDFLKNILHLRNMISHNNSIYSSTFPYIGPSVEKLYEHIFRAQPGKIKLMHIMQLIEYFSHSKTLISNTKYYLSKLKIQQKFKEKIELFESLK